MDKIMLLLIAFSAIIIPLVLIVLLRVPGKYSMPLSALSVAFLASSVWGVDSHVIGASLFQGLHRSLTILWILAGALVFLYVMQQTGAMERIRQGFSKISADMRIQTVLVAFALVAVVEGISGFGTPAAITVPLLMALGFRPLSAVVLALVGDSVPTSFGALGTPLIVGLSNVPNPHGNFVEAVASKIVLIDAVYALVLPVILVTILVFAFGRKAKRLKDVYEVLPWSLLVGAVYMVAAMASDIFIGIEFTSVIAGLSALVFGVITARKGIFQPRRSWRYDAQDEGRILRTEKPSMPLIKAWLPYGLIIGLLLLQRLLPLFREISSSWLDLSWRNILSLPQISSQWHLLSSPGTILFVVALVTAMMFPRRLGTIRFAFGKTCHALIATSIALMSTLIMVQVFANSGSNDAGYASMPVYIAEVLAHALGPVWLVIAPALGAVAAFVMGSSTISTLTMSPVEYSVASQLGIPVDVAMAAQISGANAGNMIAVHNVVAASAVSGLHHQEWRIIRHTMPVVFAYIALTAVASSLFLFVTYGIK